MRERKILGRGLASLISDPRIVERAQNQELSDSSQPYMKQEDMTAAATNASQKKVDSVVYTIALDQIAPNPYQPRRNFSPEGIAELAESIRVNGVIQPILLREQYDGKYQIIAGERRWRAACEAGLIEIPAIIKNLTETKLLETAIIENIQREELSAVEEAVAYQHLIENYGYNQDKLAKALGKSHSYISNVMRLLSLPDEVLKMVKDGKLTAGHARILIGVEEPIKMAQIFISQKLNVRAAEDYARQFSQAKQQKARVNVANPASTKDKGRMPQASRAHYNLNHKIFNQSDSDLRAIEKTVSEEIGMLVNIYDTDKGGELNIQFQTLEQLDWLLERISMPKVFSKRK